MMTEEQITQFVIMTDFQKLRTPEEYKSLLDRNTPLESVNNSNFPSGAITPVALPPTRESSSVLVRELANKLALYFLLFK